MGGGREKQFIESYIINNAATKKFLVLIPNVQKKKKIVTINNTVKN